MVSRRFPIIAPAQWERNEEVCDHVSTRTGQQLVQKLKLNALHATKRSIQSA